MAKKKSVTPEPSIASVADWLPVEDIHDDHIELAGGTLTTLLRVTPADLALIGESGRKRLITGYQETYNAEQGAFSLIIMPRTADLEPYMMRLEKRLRDETNPKKRLAIKEAMTEATRLMHEGACVERQYYMAIQEPPNADGQSLRRLRDRTANFIERLATGGIEATVCTYDQHHRALMLYAMPRQAALLPAALELSIVPTLGES